MRCAVAAVAVVAAVAAQAGVAVAGASSKVPVTVCCEPVGVAGQSAACGAGGYGYKWIATPAAERSLLWAAADEDAAALLGSDARAYALLGVVAVVALPGLAGWRRGASGLLQAGACASLVGGALTQALAVRAGDMGPLGYMRVSNVLALFCAAWMVVKVRLAPAFVAAAGGDKAEGARWADLAVYGLLVVVTFAQEKLLWRPELSASIPLAALAGIAAARGRAVVPFLAAALAAVVLADPFTRTQPSDVEALLVSPALRLYAATAWSVAAMALLRVIEAPGRGRAALACAVVGALAALAPWAPVDGDGSRAATGAGTSFYVRPGRADGPWAVGVAGRWCCVDAAEASHCESRWAHRRFHHYDTAADAAPWPGAVWAMMVITVLSNASGVPAIANTWRVNAGFPTVVGCATMAFSTLYHLADTIDGRFLGMSEGNWHRLDNVFAILSFVSLQVYVLEATVDVPAVDAVRAGFVVLTVGLQELGPWKLECTLAPVLVASALLGAYLRKHEHVRAALAANPEGHFSTALLLLGLGVAGFVKGLDQDSDTLRIAHGCWHLFTGASFLFFGKGLVLALKHARAPHHKD